MIEVREAGPANGSSIPADFGIDEAPISRRSPGGEPAENAATARAILAGEPGPAADIALLNAGAAIYVGGGADDLAGGIEAARGGDRLGCRRRACSGSSSRCEMPTRTAEARRRASGSVAC